MIYEMVTGGGFGVNRILHMRYVERTLDADHNVVERGWMKFVEYNPEQHGHRKVGCWYDSDGNEAPF